jgi:hypothetical protein
LYNVIKKNDSRRKRNEAQEKTNTTANTKERRKEPTKTKNA